MLCYRCGRTLGAGRYCLSCGADVAMYRKIARLSNRYYNIGLERAGIRDMSGAADALSRALEIDARNIAARNLLGLVDYEVGETVQALCEWVISTHYQPDDNPATGYVAELQNNPGELDRANQAIRKFNMALEHAKNESPDLALIQLQWVIEQHPKMVKARTLLALLYYQAGETAKAQKETKALLKLDRGNVLGQKLAMHIREQGHFVRPLSERIAEQARAGLDTAVTTAARTREVLSARPAFWLRFLVGTLLVVGCVWGILSPTVSRRRSTAVGSAVAVYAQQLEELRGQLEESEALSSCFEILLQMSRLDPDDPADYMQLRVLFKSLSAYEVNNATYLSLYGYWENLLAERARS